MQPIRRIAMLSLHTSPLEQPGGGDAGGMNVYVRALARELAAAGVEVEIFTRSTRPGQPAVEELSEGVLVRHIAAGPAGKVAKEQLPRLVDDLAKGIGTVLGGSTRNRFDAIHSHYWVSGMVGLLLARDWQLPLVHTMHTMAKVKNHHRSSGQSEEPGAREDGEQRIVRDASRLIANTAAEAAELESHYHGRPQRIDVISPGVDLAIFHPGSRDGSRRQLGINPGVFHVVFAGRLQRLKGPHVLVKAAALLSRKRPDIRLRVSIIGSPSGAEKYDLPRLILEHGLEHVVTLVPPMAARQLADWYRSADVVAMPSSSESFGLVALEAEACGTPVLATRVGGLPSAVRDTVTGVLVDGRDPQDWAKALGTLHDEPRERADLGLAAARFAQDFGWEHTARRTLASYDRAIAGPHIP
ncbi:D-inositol-3-phosphate glycosyltransferase [Paenarthrobacter sp. Z7-10]|uniref:D-inositol-3-phosphate glycosyltransferase n=1 Tax=Paenarthrobacter sp. Z7-10 TaxID=2787635 RepID=UPI0022A97F12|nr:D-inositol-3-phosphate glycosyltransferase [Paenarthrobacter sp. Z7-10]MCZ2404098.1 D-inositol-3-phosphate glycosyltransferase [Paenarthrobacter sp. Z7-10]